MIKYLIVLLFITFSSCKNIGVQQSCGMLPNINSGDKVIIKKTADNKYDYGDIVLFDTGRDFFAMFRVVGLPGDNIAMEDYMCIINGKKNKWEKIAENIPLEMIRISSAGEEREEEFPNGVRVRLYKETKLSVGEEISFPSFDAEYIPEGHYFVLGDTRTLTIDSRYLGPIPLKNIKGKVVKVIKE